MKFFKSKIFWLGFIIGLSLWLAINLNQVISKFQIICSHCDKGFGKPFRMYESADMINPAQVVWSGVILNMVIVILTSIISGFAVYHLWNRFFNKHLK